MAIKGGCLCGKVRYETEASPLFAGHCFCADCRKATGSGHVTAFGIASAKLHISGTLSSYRCMAEAQEVTRWFCPNCGTMVYVRSAAMSGVSNVSAGTLDAPSVIDPDFAVFHRDRADWDGVRDGTILYPGLPD